jgi:hypothetical protein
MSQGLLSLLLVMALSTSPAASQATEVTAKDITKDPALKSTDCSVFGIRLGMSREEVTGLLQETDFLWGYYNGYLLTEKKFSDIVYVYDRTGSGAVGSALLRLAFSPEGSLESITLYPGMSRYLAGESKKLVDQEILEPAVRRRLLGEPRRVEAQKLPIIDLKLDIFYFPARGFQIRHKHSYSRRTDEVYFSLVLPSPSRP